MTSSESDTAPEPQAPAAPTGEGTQEERISRIENAVTRILDKLSGGHDDTPAEPEADDAKSVAAAEARKAVQELAASEKRRAAREKERGELKKLREQVDKIVEKAPEEYRKVEGFMRWRESGKKP